MSSDLLGSDQIDALRVLASDARMKRFNELMRIAVLSPQQETELTRLAMVILPPYVIDAVRGPKKNQ